MEKIKETLSIEPACEYTTKSAIGIYRDEILFYRVVARNNKNKLPRLLYVGEEDECEDFVKIYKIIKR